jgi:hypothetical protein
MALIGFTLLRVFFPEFNLKISPVGKTSQDIAFFSVHSILSIVFYQP